MRLSLLGSKPKHFSASSTPDMTCAAKESNVSASIFIVGSRATLKSWSSALLRRSDRIASSGSVVQEKVKDLFLVRRTHAIYQTLNPCSALRFLMRHNFLGQGSRYTPINRSGRAHLF